MSTHIQNLAAFTGPKPNSKATRTSPGYRSQMDGEELSARWRGFRVVMTRALRPISIGLPIALVMVSLGFLVNPGSDGGWGNFAAIAFVAAGLFIALMALVRLFDARRAHGGAAWLSRRDSVLVGILITSGLIWLSGTVGLPALPDPNLAVVVIPNFINGMFGVCITLGLLIASARRALKA